MFRGLLIAILAFYSGIGFAAREKAMEGAHIHEAFMTNEAPLALLTAVPDEPPAPLIEERPTQVDEKTIWIPGYWDWSHKMEQFVWCSGNWRLPPPGHQWIAGNWQKMPAGWVRTKGFWSTVKESKLSYISQPPPDQLIDDRPVKPGEDYFWMSGFWKHERRGYVWYTGKWEKADKNWIYVPARYIWREQGYVFVPASWDWPIEYRGTAYACVVVPEGQLKISYGVDLIVSPETIIEQMLVCCPNYGYFYNYYYIFNPDWWWGCEWCPPWWGFDWWGFPWVDQWALWWWWGNPGFPAPWWLGGDIIIIFWGAPMPLMMAMQDAGAPLIIGPNGVAPPLTLIQEHGNDTPVFPENSTDIQRRAEKETEQGVTTRPSGRRPKPHEEGHPKPTLPIKPNAPDEARVGKQPRTPSAKPPVVVTPPKPTLPLPSKEPVEVTPPYEWVKPPQESYTEPYRPQPPVYQEPRQPYYPPAQSYQPQPHRPYNPPAQTYKPKPRRPYNPPAQTYKPKPHGGSRPPAQTYKPGGQTYSPRHEIYKPQRTAPSKSTRGQSSSTRGTFK